MNFGHLPIVIILLMLAEPVRAPPLRRLQLRAKRMPVADARVRLMIEVLLKKENSNFSRSLLDTLPKPLPEVKEKVMALWKEQERGAANAKELKKIAEEHENSISKKERLMTY